jgi:hypothetical protein
MFKNLKLCTKARMKLLGFIATVRGEHFERQIARKAGVSAGSANAILREFAREGLARKSVRGRMSFYCANEDSPVLRQYRVLLCISGIMPAVAALAPLSRRIVLIGGHASGRPDGGEIELFILARERDLVRRTLADFPHIRPLILDVVALEGLKSKDPAAYERLRSGIELHCEKEAEAD